MSQALYRKYRSKSLDEIVGQQHVTAVLKQSLKNGKSTHAYLLTGPRGVGKTSIARILAHEINSLPYDGTNHLDIIEIDAASNNGVDDIRDLREKVSLAPITAPKKIYIIDEVHMLSKPAFNALLKTLEEPPEHVVFVLATTEVHKLPDTILSRTQRFHFRTIEKQVMIDHLKEIAKKEKISITDDALSIISERAKGSFRDAISLLDQLQSSSESITAESITQSLGLADQTAISQLVAAIISRTPETVIQTLQELEDQGVSAVTLADQLSRQLRTEVITTPSLITTIERLIEVGRSFDPQLKLFAILLEASQKQQKIVKSASLTASQPSISVAAPPPISAKKQPDSKRPDHLKTAMKTSAKQVETTADTPALTSPEEIVWPDVLEHIRTNYLVIYGVLQKATMTYENKVLNLHFPYVLHKKKLDDNKYKQMLTASLVAVHGTSPSITTSSGKLPPKNKQARDVAAIMGGGEEVTV